MPLVIQNCLKIYSLAGTFAESCNRFIFGLWKFHHVPHFLPFCCSYTVSSLILFFLPTSMIVCVSLLHRILRVYLVIFFKLFFYPSTFQSNSLSLFLSFSLRQLDAPSLLSIFKLFRKFCFIF